MVSPGSGSLEFAPLKFTLSGALPDVGIAESTAKGALFGWQEALPTIVYSPEGVRLSGQLSGVMTPAVTLIKKESSCSPMPGLPTPLRGTTMVIVPSAVKLLSGSAGDNVPPSGPYSNSTSFCVGVPPVRVLICTTYVVPLGALNCTGQKVAGGRTLKSFILIVKTSLSGPTLYGSAMETL